MIANYHTHTALCRHARGTVADYAQAALEAGLRILGYSDHTPYWFPGDYYSHMRMFPEQLAGYAEEVRTVREACRGKMQVHLGLEVEYYPAYFGELLPRLRDQGIEYMLLGQHWLGSEIGEPYSGTPTEDEGQLRRYCDQVIEALQTGLFTYVAHPDVFQFTGDEAVYQEEMRKICVASRECNVPLEINFLGIREGRPYPRAAFWPLAAEEQAPVTFGFDAHQTEFAYDGASLAVAEEMVKQYGLNYIGVPNIISIEK